MIVRAEDAAYIQAVIAALTTTGTLPVSELTSVCPECSEEQTRWYSDAHLVVLDDDEDPDAAVVVVIGCEGYRVINPNLVGIDAPNWQDWKA